MPWLVHATPPKNPVAEGWDYRHNYFPRRFHYKREALEAQRDAKRRGGTDVRIEKVDNNYRSL